MLRMSNGNKQRASMVDVKKDGIVKLFSKFHVTLKEAWLNEVLEYLQMERADADIPTVIQLVYEQWLFSELSNSTRPKIRLPPFEKKSSLDTDVVVQINWLIDVHTSMYSKLNQHVRHNTDNNSFPREPDDEAEVFFHSTYSKDLDLANRMYLMEVTDGQRKLRAIEYQKIDELCGKLSHGTKLLIYGGTICRRNVLLLTPNNVMILGGESEMCQQNAPALIVARRLAVDEKKLKSMERMRGEEFENSMKTMKGIEMEGAEEIQIMVPSVLMRENIAPNLGEQQDKNKRDNNTVKGENPRGKKQKRPVLSRTITSYFQPQHKVRISELSPKVSTKSQIPSAAQETNEKLEPERLPRNSVQKQRGGMEPPPLLLPIADSKQQSQYPTATTVFPRESNEPSAKQSGPCVAPSRVLCTQKIINDCGISELQEVTEDTISMLQRQPQNVQNLRTQSEKVSLSARLWSKNFETTRSQVTECDSPASSAREINATVILSGESERKEATVKPLVPIRSVDKRNFANVILHSAIISSPNIQEKTIWNANKWQHATSENSKQFLTNEFRVPPSKMDVQRMDDDSNAKSIDSVALQRPTSPPQNSLGKQATFSDLHEEQKNDTRSKHFEINSEREGF
uniref:RecQ-mediated genome instability protein 1 n=1 Tax=Elaeophora elaphi TaxID=1147741 RepID=A0A158Q881_9BILA